MRIYRRYVGSFLLGTVLIAPAGVSARTDFQDDHHQDDKHQRPGRQEPKAVLRQEPQRLPHLG